jgi:RNA polymerase sigma factor (TIGR02999 family)
LAATSTVTQLLHRVRATGDQAALNELVSVLYHELHRIASRQMRGERDNHTLQTTALVNEAYLKLSGNSLGGFADRAHFLAVASRVMREVLVDHARSRATKKRAGDQRINTPSPVWISSIHVGSKASSEELDLLDLDAALEALARKEPALVKLIEMHYFGGMTAEEVAEVLKQSVHVVRHDLRLAQAWLRRKLIVRESRASSSENLR